MKTPYLRLYRNNEVMQFLQDTVNVVEEHNAKELQLNKPLQGLKKTTAEMITVSQQDSKSDLTDDIAQLDESRDADSTGIRYVIVGYTYHEDEAVKEAAELILRQFDKLGGNLTNMNYQAQTSATTTLTDEWKNNPEVNRAVAKVGLTNWFSNLDKKNQKFNDLFLERIRQQAQSPEVKIPELRKQGVQQYRELVKHIEAYATITQNETYDVIIKELNVLIEKYNSLVTKKAEE